MPDVARDLKWAVTLHTKGSAFAVRGMRAKREYQIWSG